MKYDIVIDTAIGMWGISAQYIRNRLSAMKDRPVTVCINSLGGDVRHALDIRQQFIDHGNVTAYIFGMSASAATILAMGAKKIVMSKFSTMLIHQCSQWVDSWGTLNSDQIREEVKKLTAASDNLSKIDGVIASCYAARSGRSVEEYKAVMTKADWLTADECKQLGLIDAITEEGEKPTISDDEALRITASGYPDPRQPHEPLQPAQDNGHEPEAETQDNDSEHDEHTEDAFFDKFLNAVRRFLKMDERHKNENQIQTNNAMNKDFKTVASALQVESISASEDGTYHLTAEQLEAINQKMTDDAGQIAQLQQTNQEQQQKIEDLGKEDSTNSPHIEGSEGQTESAAEMLARAKKLYR